MPNISPDASPNAIDFADFPSLTAALTSSVAESLDAGLRHQGRASLVVSGGRTPAPFFRALSQHDLDWSQVWITLADERWVEADHADSNAAIVHQHLLQHYAARAHFVALKNPAPTPHEGEAACATALSVLPRPFDVVVLGMGDDGHTASLFPQAPQLSAALDLHSGRRCMAVDPVTAPHARMSLTLPALLHSRRIMVLINGANKKQVYQHALKAGPVTTMPIRAILRQAQVPVDVYWCP